MKSLLAPLESKVWAILPFHQLFSRKNSMVSLQLGSERLACLPAAGQGGARCHSKPKLYGA